MVHPGLCLDLSWLDSRWAAIRSDIERFRSARGPQLQPRSERMTTWWPRRHSNAWRTGGKALVWLPGETWRNCEAFHRAAAGRSCSPMALRSTCFEVQTWLKTSGIRPRRAPPGWLLAGPNRKHPVLPLFRFSLLTKAAFGARVEALNFSRPMGAHNNRLFLPYSVLSFDCSGKIKKHNHCLPFWKMVYGL